MRIPILWRRRLTLIGPLHNGDGLKRYRDTETGVYYVGRGRYDPFLARSVMNILADRKP